MKIIIETVTPSLVKIEVSKVMCKQEINEEGLEFVLSADGELINEETVFATYSYNPLTHKAVIDNGKFTFISKLTNN